MAKKLTPIEIIDDTIAYYSEDINRRALNNNGILSCGYYLKEGKKVKKCAVGRCLKRGVAKKLEEDTKDIDSIIQNIIDDEVITWTDFKKKYQYPNIEFWSQLQELHDDCENWNKKGLSSLGKRRVIVMKRINWE